MARCLMLILLMVTCSSCARMNQARVYSTAERNAMMFAITGQAADIATTSYAFSQGGYSEVNPMFGDADSNSELLTTMFATKVLLVGGGYFIGQIWPESRTTLWRCIGGVGFGFAGWNTYQLVK